MNQTNVVFDATDGSILCVAEGPVKDANSLQPFLDLYPNGIIIPGPDGTSPNDHYVVLGSGEPAVLPKEDYVTEHVVTGLELTFAGLPPNAIIRVKNEEIITDGVDDGVVFDVPGTYTIYLSGLVNYRDATLEVTVNA